MINLVHYTLSTGGCNRNLIIHPVLSAYGFSELHETNLKFIIYESLISVDEIRDEEILKYFNINTASSNEQYDNEVCLGCLTIDLNYKDCWTWEGKSPGFSIPLFKELIGLILTHTRSAIDNANDFSVALIPFAGKPEPEGFKEFTIVLKIDGEMHECKVQICNSLIEVQLRYAPVLFMKDKKENYIQIHGDPLPEYLQADIVKQIVQRSI